MIEQHYSHKISKAGLAAIGLGEVHQAKPAHQRLEELERLSGHATIAIALGIAIEILVVILFSHETGWPKGLSIVADAVIFLGLAVEFVVVRRSVTAGREEKIAADKEVAQANNAAAQAQMELRNYRTPRRDLMTKEARLQLIGKLTPFADTKFDSGLASGPAEIIHFCWDLEETLKDAGWRQLDWGTPQPQLSYSRNLRPLAGMVMADDVEIQLEPNHRGTNINAAIALVDALKEIGISAKITDYLFSNTNVDALHILIGPKL